VPPRNKEGRSAEKDYDILLCRVQRKCKGCWIISCRGLSSQIQEIPDILGFHETSLLSILVIAVSHLFS
jgi:hypothetical protein